MSLFEVLLAETPDPPVEGGGGAGAGSGALVVAGAGLKFWGGRVAGGAGAALGVSSCCCEDVVLVTLGLVDINVEEGTKTEVEEGSATEVEGLPVETGNTGGANAAGVLMAGGVEVTIGVVVDTLGPS